MMQIRRPNNDGSDLSILKEVPVILKDIKVSVDGFPKTFWKDAADVIHPMEIGLGIGLIIGCIATLLVFNILGKRQPG